MFRMVELHSAVVGCLPRSRLGNLSTFWGSIIPTWRVGGLSK